jgi:hypothetical protein
MELIKLSYKDFERFKEDQITPYTLQNMSRQPVTPVEPLRIDPLQAPHSAGKVRLGRFQQKVIVVAH